MHVQDGVDGLAPPETVTLKASALEPQRVIGMTFKWSPDRVLYVADTGNNRIVLLHLNDDLRHFLVASKEAINSAAFNEPVDIAPAIPEIANPVFASHTTLAGASDIYVANRGDGSLLRVTQDGRLVARAQIIVPGRGVLSAGRIQAIATSADAQRIWLTIDDANGSGTGSEGALLEVPAFDAFGAYSREASVRQEHSGGEIAGQIAFQEEFTPAKGLGPLFNATSCTACHPGPDNMSSDDLHLVRRVAHMDPVSGRVSPLVHPNSPVARRYSTRDFGQPDAPAAMIPREANVVSLRMPLPLYASAMLDEISDASIEANAVSKGDGIKGRVNIVTTQGGGQRLGRYGWKAQIATLDEMIADALTNEMGIVSALAPSLEGRTQTQVKDDGTLTKSLSAYVRTIRLPAGPGQ